jgi:Asparagine synthase
MTLGTDVRGRGREHLRWLGPEQSRLDAGGTISGWSSGYGFLDDGSVLQGLDVARHLAAFGGRIDDAVANFNGCFACVLSFPDRAVLAVDRGGTTPIYTTTVNGEYVASIDPWSVVEAVGAGAELDDMSVLDMLRLGYVAGDRTLVRGVQLVPSGTVVHVARHRPLAQRYWMFRPYEQKVASDAPLEHALRSNIESVVSLLDGRVAGVPLSGGLDTRVITTLLHNSGANVRAFTYGPPGEPEVEIGANVAATLGVKHEIVPIDQHYLEDNFIADSAAVVGLTTRFTCGLGARHVDGGDIDVFVPGHGGCYSDYQLGVFNAPVSNREQAWKYVYWKHYQLDADDAMPARLFDVDYDAQRWRSVEETMAELDLRGDVVGEMYRWSVENRQRKLIAMEQRAYERLGPWVFPLHDHRVTDFFLSAPRRLLASQRAYKQVAARIFEQYAPALAAIPRIGGGLAYDRKVAIAAAVLTATRPVSGYLLPELHRRAHAFNPTPIKPKGAESIRYWFNRDAATRDYLLDRVAALDIPVVRPAALRDALLDADNDKLFTRTLAGAITVQEVSNRLRGLRTIPATRPDTVAS